MKSADEIFELVWAVLILLESFLRMFGRAISVFFLHVYDWDNPVWKILTIIFAAGMVVLIGWIIVRRRRRAAVSKQAAPK